ncbi:putative mini-chromosome maintenance deficient 9 [Operophtera brumata]|uniref:DNA helicase MCM9 n=1 Tax=Operophtera brumata TaxID=104452 RepID=A0A0L7LPQ2_OPEBR|nr:putative mini-chromosome maintenance deficient 9 [Operophtera brumata]
MFPVPSANQWAYDYLIKFHLQDVLDILSEKDNLGYFNIKIDFLKLFESHPDVGDKVLCNPVESLPVCNRDIQKAQQNVMEFEEYKPTVLKLDYCYLKRNVQARFFGLPVCPELHRTVFPKNVDLGCFLKITEAKFENRYILKAPTHCQNDIHNCKNGTFTQEQVNKLSIGTIPGSMWVVLENDLVDCCKPVLQANYVEVCNALRSVVVAAAPDVKECFDAFWGKYTACPLKGRDQILMGVCPQRLEPHRGRRHQVFARRQARHQGTGKSQLLRSGVELTARAVFTSGAGSTRAGLTCAALREDGEWQLEAGALVLSDGGAGIVCKLNTRCAIIAACNPKGHYQTDQPLSANVSLGTPLLTWDKLVSSFILFGDNDTTKSKKTWNTEKLQVFLITVFIKVKHATSTKTVHKMYISLIGPRATKITKSANVILQSYYMLQRKSQQRDPSRTTVRMLDSLVRLSQAHCRLMYRTTILPMDAVIAVSLVDLSMQDCTLDDTVDALHSTFQTYPDFDYLCTANKLLTRLHLTEIWQNELLFYGKLLQVDHKTLETDIENGNTRLFAKFDDFSDDSIPLSASLVTSSYFNDKKVATDKENVQNENGRNAVNERLAATLKKHANLNLADKKPPVTKKRKRKEVTVDSSNVKNAIKKRKSKKNNEQSDSSDSGDCRDAQNILKAVPSVNDAFAGLGIDFNFDNDNTNSFCENIIDNTESPDEITATNNCKFKAHSKQTCDRNISNDARVPTKTSNKLNQFLFVKNCDVEKYEEKPTKPNESVNKLKSKESSLSSLNQKSTTSSQISMFESDCDIDLDF